MAKSMNPINIIQKWMDTMAGQTFMQYAYSWGAAVVILGTLFKLTHIPGANAMLFIGMGTEVFVFFVAGFERVTEKAPENNAVASGQQVIVQGGGSIPAVSGGVVATELPEGVTPAEEGQSGPIVIGGGPAVVGGGSAIIGGGPVVAGGGPAVVGGGPVVMGGGPVVSGVTGISGLSGTSAASAGAPIDPEALAQGAALSAAAANLASAGQAAAEAQLALSQLQNGGAGIDPNQIKATDPAAIEEAVKNYAEELSELTEVLGRVKVQAARMSTDSEEMENLNRTLTGIATVYELQLRNISKQVATIEQIDEQTRRMAQQIEELNNVYGRMIKALTINMAPAAAVAPTTEG